MWNGLISLDLFLWFLLCFRILYTQLETRTAMTTFIIANQSNCWNKSADSDVLDLWFLMFRERGSGGHPIRLLRFIWLLIVFWLFCIVCCGSSFGRNTRCSRLSHYPFSHQSSFCSVVLWVDLFYLYLRHWYLHRRISLFPIKMSIVFKNQFKRV